MNKIIKVCRISTDEDTRKALIDIIELLEKQNFAIVENLNASKEFSRCLPIFYKEKDIILVSETSRQKNKPKRKIITVSPEYCIEKSGDFNFRVKLRDVKKS
jgi:hypothetical protein